LKLELAIAVLNLVVCLRSKRANPNSDDIKVVLKHCMQLKTPVKF